MGLAFSFVASRDRLDVLDSSRMEEIIAGRSAIAANATNAIHRLDNDSFNPARNVIENLLFGVRRFDRQDRWPELDLGVFKIIENSGFGERLLNLALERDFKRAAFNAADRRLLALLQGLIKQPKLLLLDGIFATASKEDSSLRKQIRNSLPESIIIYRAANAEACAEADLILQIDMEGNATLLQQERREVPPQMGMVSTADIGLEA